MWSYQLGCGRHAATSGSVSSFLPSHSGPSIRRSHNKLGCKRKSFFNLLVRNGSFCHPVGSSRVLMPFHLRVTFHEHGCLSLCSLCLGENVLNVGFNIDIKSFFLISFHVFLAACFIFFCDTRMNTRPSFYIKYKCLFFF